MPNKIRNSLMHFLGAVACLVLLTSCGGGGGAGSTATMPTAQAPEMINGIAVPPEPNPTINNATLAGVDSNNNGVRDDVERKIATNAKNSQAATANLIIAKAVQSDILRVGQVSSTDYNTAMCYLYKTDSFLKVSGWWINSIEREKADSQSIAFRETPPCE
jgi:threonine dehydratase